MYNHLLPITRQFRYSHMPWMSCECRIIGSLLCIFWKQTLKIVLKEILNSNFKLIKFLLTLSNEFFCNLLFYDNQKSILLKLIPNWEKISPPCPDNANQEVKVSLFLHPRTILLHCYFFPLFLLTLFFFNSIFSIWIFSA